ncbi:MAG TPA: ROK family protein [Armatimonadota bacterium]|nr:ROK family protein [Armatimonadota bacterium]
MTMQKNSSTSNNRRQQKAAERTGINLLRYVLDHPHTTCRAAAEDLGMSFPNVCRLVSEFTDSGILTGQALKQTGKRGPWSRVVSMRPNLGCSIGVDLEATQVRGVILDYAGDLEGVLRRPIEPSARPNDIICAVAEIAGILREAAREQKLDVCAVGLALPGPVIDTERGRVQTDLQFGEAMLEFVPVVEGVCGVKTVSASNSYCFAAGHHRMHNPRGLGIEMVILNRFGLAAALIWDGALYTGASHYAGDLGMFPCDIRPPARHFKEICTGAALLNHARLRGNGKSFQELLQSPNDPIVKEWLDGAIPAFSQAIFAAVIAYNPGSVLIEGIFNRFPENVRRRIITDVREELAKKIGYALPEIAFFEGDDLMGARGAALLARDTVADDVLASLIRNE